MNLLRESLYFAFMHGDRFGEIVSYKTASPKILSSKNVFELLHIRDGEIDFLKHEIKAGGASLIVISSKHGRVLVDRGLMYSLGICCFVTFELTDAYEERLMRSDLFDGCVFSVSARVDEGKALSECGRYTSVYAEAVRLFELLSVFEASYYACDFCELSKKISDYMGCRFELSETIPQTHAPDIVCNRGMYAFCVFMMCSLLRLISDERKINIIVDSSRVSIRISVGMGSERRILENIHPSLVSREMQMCTRDGSVLSLDFCPFYEDVGMHGVKAKIEFRYI